MDKLEALRIFRHAVELNNFSRVGEYLNLSQSSISKAIRQLEEELKTRLFNRTTRRIFLTESGENYYHQICRILDDLNSADISMSDCGSVPQGLLRICAPITFSVVTLTKRIPEFLKNFPYIRLDLNMDDHTLDFFHNNYDLIIRANARHIPDSSLIVRKLMTMEHVLVAAPEYIDKNGLITHPDQLMQQHTIHFSLTAHADMWTFEKNGKTIKHSVDGRYRVSSSLGILDAVRAGIGYSLVPKIYIEDDLKTGSLISVLDDWIKDETNVFVLYPSKIYVPVKTRIFLDFLQTVYKADKSSTKETIPLQDN